GCLEHHRAAQPRRQPGLGNGLAADDPAAAVQLRRARLAGRVPQLISVLIADHSRSAATAANTAAMTADNACHLWTMADIGSAYRRRWRVLDDVPITTDKKVVDSRSDSNGVTQPARRTHHDHRPRRGRGLRPRAVLELTRKRAVRIVPLNDLRSRRCWPRCRPGDVDRGATLPFAGSAHHVRA